MNDNAQEWIDVLRSGKYKQTRDTLRDQDGYCCLGVACDIFDGSLDIDMEVKTLWDDMGYHYDGGSKTLSPDVRRFFGLNDDAGGYDYLPADIEEWLMDRLDEADRDSIPGSLAELNDAGLTFDEITMVIESEPKGLFQAEEDDDG